MRQTRTWLALLAGIAALPLPGCATKAGRISADALADALEEAREDWLVVDVRSDAKWRAPGGHIEGALHVPYPGIKDVAGQAIRPAPGQRVVLICFTGHRSQWSIEAVRAALEADVVDLQGGMLAWWSRSLPVVVEDPDAPAAHAAGGGDEGP